MPILGTSASQNSKSFLGIEVDYLVVAGGGAAGGVGVFLQHLNAALDLAG